eukprot:3438538-Heterocapsa_arctica.AAC.1
MPGSTQTATAPPHFEATRSRPHHVVIGPSPNMHSSTSWKTMVAQKGRNTKVHESPWHSTEGTGSQSPALASQTMMPMAWYRNTMLMKTR